MKKYMYGGLFLLLVVLGLNACNKDISQKINGGAHYDLELKQLFAEAKNTKSLADSVPNPNNPYDSAGIFHNIVLDYIRGLDTSDFCFKVSKVKETFNVSGYSCSSVTDVAQNNFHEIVDSVSQEYSSELFYSLYTSHKISYREYQVLNTTFQEVNDTDDLGDRIKTLKIAEDYVLELTTIENEAKERILSSFAILRYSMYYWDTNPAALCDVCVAFADAAAIYFGQNCMDCPFEEDGAAINSFAALVSSIASEFF